MKKLSVRLVLVLTALAVAALFGSACEKGDEIQIPVENQIPVISSISSDLASVAPGDSTIITSVASDPDGDSLSYNWSTNGGSLSGMGKVVTWTAPEVAGTYSITVTVDDGRDGTANKSYTITVVSVVARKTNKPPLITSLTASPKTIEPGTSTTITCIATDPEGDPLTYRWFNADGNRGYLEGTGNVVVLPPPNLVIEGTGNIVTWTAPTNPGEYVIAVNVWDSRYGDVTETITVTVAKNKPPVITKLSAKPTTVIVDHSATITVVASDPEGNPLTYSWSATNGSISGAGNVVTWTAPSRVAYSNIEVTVNDGRGGTVTRSVTVQVQGRKLTRTIAPMSSESGSIHSDGQLQTAWRVGDKGANNGIRAFLSFNISKITDVEEFGSAVLSISTLDQNGTPWADLGSLYIDEVDYGTRPLQADDYDLPPGSRLASYDSAPITEIDLTEIIKRAVRDGSPRFQIALYFEIETDDNDATDNIKITIAELTISYIEKTW